MECGLCHADIKRSVYWWNINYVRHPICPRCNSALNRKASKKAMDLLDGKVDNRPDDEVVVVSRAEPPAGCLGPGCAGVVFATIGVGIWFLL